MIIATNPSVFVNASRSLMTEQEKWFQKCPVHIYFEYGSKWNNGVLGCSKEGECYHLKFGGSDWTFVANLAGGYRVQANSGTYGGKYWIFGGKGNKILFSNHLHLALGFILHIIDL